MIEQHLPALLEFLNTAFAFIVTISVIVFVHEFGHYVVAKWCGVKVEVFSIGFGRELLGWTDRSGTRWKIAWLPLGGYVKMFGDAGAASTPDANLDSLSEEDKKRTFHHKPLWQKAAVVAAGPVTNFLLTIIILTGFIFTSGLPTTEPVIGEILPGSAAQEAGLRPGDRVLSVDGVEVDTFSDIPRLIATNLGTPVRLELVRKEQTLTKMIIPRITEEDDALGNKSKRPLIGFRSMEMKYEDVGFASAIWEATRRTYMLCETTVVAVGQMIAGDRGTDDLRGPLGIAQLSGQAAEKGWDTIFWFIAMLSANLGLVNLFPVPLLDGGHLLYYAVEALQGRPLAQKVQTYGFRLGFLLLMGLMALTLFNDLRQLF